MALPFLKVQSSGKPYVSIKDTIPKKNMDESYGREMDANYACFLVSLYRGTVLGEEKKKKTNTIGNT